MWTNDANFSWQSVILWVWQWIGHIYCVDCIPCKYTVCCVLYSTGIRCTHFKKITNIATLTVKYGHWKCCPKSCNHTVMQMIHSESVIQATYLDSAQATQPKWNGLSSAILQCAYKCSCYIQNLKVSYIQCQQCQHCHGKKWFANHLVRSSTFMEYIPDDSLDIVV